MQSVLGGKVLKITPFFSGHTYCFALNLYFTFTHFQYHLTVATEMLSNLLPNPCTPTGWNLTPVKIIRAQMMWWGVALPPHSCYMCPFPASCFKYRSLCLLSLCASICIIVIVIRGWFVRRWPAKWWRKVKGTQAVTISWRSQLISQLAGPASKLMAYNSYIARSRPANIIIRNVALCSGNTAI